MDSEIIEADFQQYYHLELSHLLTHDFMRFCRLLLQLPFESRFVQKYCPSKDWDWDKEIRSQILHTLDIISCQLANMMKKEGRASSKPQPQLQPEYVKRAKEEATTNKHGEQISDDDLEDMQQFWQEYNCNTKEI